MAVGDLKGELNLTETAMGLGLENIEYEPEQFPGMVYRIKEPKVAMLLFSSGKIVCTGARKISNVSIAAEKLSEKLKALGLLRQDTNWKHFQCTEDRGQRFETPPL